MRCTSNKMGQPFWEKQIPPVIRGEAHGFSGRPDSLSVPSSPKTFMSATRASDLYPHGPNCTKDRRDLDWRSLTANYELMLMKVCHEVSMRLCFWLTAVIATQQERLPALLVDPACKFKLAWCEYMQGQTFALVEIEGCRRCRVAATTVDNSRTVVTPMVLMLCVLFSFFVSGVVARCRDVVARQRSAHAVEHRLTALMRALLHVSLYPEVWLRIAVAQCENIFVGSHAPHKGHDV